MNVISSEKIKPIAGYKEIDVDTKWLISKGQILEIRVYGIFT